MSNQGNPADQGLIKFDELLRKRWLTTRFVALVAHNQMKSVLIGFVDEHRHGGEGRPR